MTESESELARLETKKYHTEYYKQHTLFQKGSWLERPDKYIRAVIDLIGDKPNRTALDLGCGVGRNAIPLAESGFAVSCIDNLPEALDLLQKYAERYRASSHLTTQQCDIDIYEIPKKSFDALLAISVLEHARSLSQVSRLMHQMHDGTRTGGVVLITISTDRKVTEVGSPKQIPTAVEAKMSAQEARSFLSECFRDWSILDLSTETYEEQLFYGEQFVNWTSTEVRLLAAMRG